LIERSLSTRKASTPNLVTVWMAVAKSGVPQPGGGVGSTEASRETPAANAFHCQPDEASTPSNSVSQSRSRHVAARAVDRITGRALVHRSAASRLPRRQGDRNYCSPPEAKAIAGGPELREKFKHPFGRSGQHGAVPAHDDRSL
jgi:hypothetical protein